MKNYYPEVRQFEDELLSLLSDQNPTPAFQLWQKVRFSKSGIKNELGVIVGFEYVTPGIAFEEQISPGWHYTIQHGWGHESVPQSGIASTSQLQEFPTPKFSMGQRVRCRSVDEEGMVYEEGVIYGLSSYDPTSVAGEQYVYLIHFDVPRVFDDKANESELTAIG